MVLLLVLCEASALRGRNLLLAIDNASALAAWPTIFG